MYVRALVWLTISECKRWKFSSHWRQHFCGKFYLFFFLSLSLAFAFYAVNSNALQARFLEEKVENVKERDVPLVCKLLFTFSSVSVQSGVVGNIPRVYYVESVLEAGICAPFWDGITYCFSRSFQRKWHSCLDITAPLCTPRKGKIKRCVPWV